MRKPIAILLLFSFLAAQYARQASYLECKLVNYFSGSAVKCDCERLLISDNDPPASPNPATHNHLHLDEWYNLGYRYHLLPLVSSPPQDWLLMHNNVVMDGNGRAPDRPPQPI